MEAQRAQSQAGQADQGIQMIMPQTPLGAALNPQSQAAESAPLPTTAPTPQPVLGQHTTDTAPMVALYSRSMSLYSARKGSGCRFETLHCAGEGEIFLTTASMQVFD